MSIVGLLGVSHALFFLLEIIICTTIAIFIFDYPASIETVVCSRLPPQTCHCIYTVIPHIYVHVHVYDIIIICLLFQLFKEKAVQIVDKLLPAFKTPSGIPKSLVNFGT